MAVAFMSNVVGKVPPSVMAQLSEHLASVERVLSRRCQSQVESVDTVGRTTLEAGGKRLRPALVAVCGLALNPQADQKRLAFLGSAIEMIHMASLVHDDVMDHASMRRGKPTAASIVGNESAILSGDVLLAKSMMMLAEDGDLTVIREMAAAVVRTAEGQVAEIDVRDNLDLPREDHLNIIRNKTADLLASCCRVGALAAGASAEVVDQIGQYGEQIGMAFQIVDDLLDYRGDHTKTGKPWATDFREGCATLPLIDLRESIPHNEFLELTACFGGDVSTEQLTKLKHRMTESGSFKRCALEAKTRIAEAKRALETVPPSPHRHLLHAVADFVIERDL